jgi:hypothetical protein
MNLNDLESRVRLLDQLSRGLAKEALLWGRGHQPLLYRELQGYLAAIQTALSGIEGARVTLVKARQRVRGRQGQGAVLTRPLAEPLGRPPVRHSYSIWDQELAPAGLVIRFTR